MLCRFSTLFRNGLISLNIVLSMGFYRIMSEQGSFTWELMLGNFLVKLRCSICLPNQTSVLLDGYSAAGITHGRFQHHSTVDSSLTQLFTFLCQLSSAPAYCTFVYDGSDRPINKRGKNVIKKEPLLYRQSKVIVKAFGFQVHTVRTFFIQMPDRCFTFRIRRRVMQKPSLQP